MRTGVRSTSYGALAEMKGALVPVLMPSPIGPAQIYCLQGSETRALPSPWAVFELQGCCVKFSILFLNIIYVQRGHLLVDFSQKLLAPSSVRKYSRSPVQSYCNGWSLHLGDICINEKKKLNENRYHSKTSYLKKKKKIVNLIQIQERRRNQNTFHIYL